MHNISSVYNNPSLLIHPTPFFPLWYPYISSLCLYLYFCTEAVASPLMLYIRIYLRNFIKILMPRLYTKDFDTLFLGLGLY